MSELTTIARPYAKAAFDFAVEQNAIDDWHQMLVFAAEVANNEQMSDFLSGAMAVEQVTKLFIEVCGEQLNGNGQNLIKLMAENGRLQVLPEVLELFSELRLEHEKEVNVDVVSAVELDAAQQDKLSASLEKRLARKVKLNCSVDSSIVAGMVIKAGDMVIDGSVKGKLGRLTDALQS